MFKMASVVGFFFLIFLGVVIIGICNLVYRVSMITSVIAILIAIVGMFVDVTMWYRVCRLDAKRRLANPS